MSRFPGHLPAAGGLEDQDALLLAALGVLRDEQSHFDLITAEERHHGSD